MHEHLVYEYVHNDPFGVRHTEFPTFFYPTQCASSAYGFHDQENMGEAVGRSCHRCSATKWYLLRKGYIFVARLADAIADFWAGLEV